ncbi:MAG: hypothetical protein GOV00_04180 [Candidatus Altiarchaeota archaeon]|nr:hypothetical protein [Candidatus Altiarchaeota archaeon]
MKQFSEWGMQFAPTLIILMVIIFALFGARKWVIQGFMSVLASTNIMTGFFSHLTKAVGYATGGLGG